MIDINSYCVINKISRRSVYRLIQRGHLKSKKINGIRYIYDTPDTTPLLSPETSTLRMHFDSLIKRAIKLYSEDPNNGEIKSIQDYIIKQNMTMKLRGYDYKSLRRKITKGIIDRKPRSDRFTIKNHILKDEKIFQTALKIIAPYFFKDSHASLNLAIDRLLMKAREDESLYEIAAIPKSTLYTAINRHIKASGYRTIHEFMNHYNSFENKRIRVQGSFTTDIDFMQVWALDDHKMDIAGAYVYNEKTGKLEQKQVTSWVLIEAKTMFPLAWRVQTGSFNADDIVDLLAQALLKYGRPTEKIICDQGLGKEARVKRFCFKADVLLDPQLPYEPTHKATVERFFKFVKDETDSYQNNFVGSNHQKEGKHSTSKLSPEDTRELIEESIKRYDEYFTGLCVNRPRKRSLPGIDNLLDKSGCVSINTLFKNYYKNFKKNQITSRQLRMAYMKEDSVKKFVNYIRFKNDTYMPAEVLSPALNNRKYTIAYIPFDLTTIDIYATDSFYDAIDGREYSPGDYVCTLTSQKSMPSDERRSKVSIHNKSYRKLIKDLIPDDLTPEIRPDGSVSDIRKKAERALISEIKNALPPDKIDAIATTLKNTSQPVSESEIDKYFVNNTITNPADNDNDIDYLFRNFNNLNNKENEQ